MAASAFLDSVMWSNSAPNIFQLQVFVPKAPNRVCSGFPTTLLVVQGASVATVQMGFRLVNRSGQRPQGRLRMWVLA